MKNKFDAQISLTQLTQKNESVVNSILHSLPHYFTYEPTIKYYCEESIKDGNVTCIATAGGINIGCAIISAPNETTSEILVMAVNPDYQRLGVGSAILRWAENYSRNIGKTFMFIKTIGPSQNDSDGNIALAFFLKNDYCLLEEFDFIWQDCFCAFIIKKL